MEEQIRAACEAKHIAGAVIMASNKSGSFTYKNAFGIRSMKNENDPMTEDSVMWIASCTKLITTIAAMQCVERGLVTLDEDIRTIVPELADLEILQGDETGKISSRRKNAVPITLRQLLTHTSGLAYEPLNPLIQTWRAEQVEEGPARNIRQRFLHPLVFEPGVSWAYGPSIDWAGVVVERVTKSETLAEYMDENIWKPLGIKDMTFFLSTRPDLQARQVAMSSRNEGPTVTYSERQHMLEPDWEDCLGGEGISTCAGEYLKVLQALLRATDGQASDDSMVPAGQLLRRSTANAMFEPNLSEASRTQLMVATQAPVLSRIIGDLPAGTQKDWGLGGMLVQEDLARWRSKGTMTWSGFPHWTWWIDREVGLCGVFATQIVPIGDAKTNELLHAFEKAMYERYAASETATR